MAESTGHYNAMRFAQNPLPQPCYTFAHVPKAARDLSGSSLQHVVDRENLKTCMAEMLLLCKEAMRRRPGKGGNGSKPLSLEYLADRLDVDDPCFGYLIRTGENEHANATADQQPHCRKGMLQGFITVTTFTNWQKTFEWNSSNDVAFSYDDQDLDQLRVLGVRKWDESNALAAELQQTVRCGDIHNEGVVWPRVAEISLLGGLGCGRALVSLVIEELERMKATAKRNYDFVVLQATDNSIPFYESLGFVRVGALVQDETEQRSRSASNDSSSDDAVEAEPLPEGSPEKTNAIAHRYDIVTGPELSSYTIKKAGETPSEIAKKLDVNMYDILFLNKDIYADIGPGSRLLAGTILHMPVKNKTRKQPETPLQVKTRRAKAETPRWYVAKENETPRTIAKQFEVSCVDVIEANKARLPGLLSNSRLKDGTRMKISHFDEHDKEYKPYAHWTFPDDMFEDGEPSYMMALKLDRCKGAAARVMPFRESLAVPVSEYEATDLLLPPSPVRKAPPAASLPVSSAKRGRSEHPDAPVPPKRALGPYMVFAMDQRETNSDVAGMAIGESSKIISVLWKNLSSAGRKKHEDVSEKARAKYRVQKDAYDLVRAEFDATHPMPATPTALSRTLAESVPKVDLFNKVVRLKTGAMTEGSEFSYWFVLTFIPDLKWCHLAPMIQIGTFGPEKPKSQGRPKWKLVDESLGKEVDISSSYCIPIKSKSMKRTQDADKEEWDIIDDGSCPGKTKSASRSFGRQASSYDSDYGDDSEPAFRPMHSSGAAIKPSAERKRKHSAVQPAADSSPLIAVLPGADTITYVRLSSTSLDEDDSKAPIKKVRGRPKGSKNKPKDDVLAKPLGRPKKFAVKDTSPSVAAARRGRPRKSDVAARLSPSKAVPTKRGRGYQPKDQVVAKASPALTLTNRKRGRISPKGSKNPPRPGRHSLASSTGSRPRRNAAPSYMGESPMTPHAGVASSRRGRQSSAKSTPGFVRDTPVRTRSPGRPRRIAASIGSNVQTSPIRESATRKTPRSVGRPSSSRRQSPVLTSPVRRSSVAKSRSSSVTKGRPTATSPRTRPTRSAAPSFLGETPIQDTPPPSSALKSRRMGGRTPSTPISSAAKGRPKRKAAPSFLGESADRKRRLVNTSGSRRSVRQS